MREFTVPQRYSPPPEATMVDDVFVHAERHPDHPALWRRVDGAWTPVTSKEFATAVDDLAAALISSGVQAGERVALFSHTRFEWLLCDAAIWTAGGVTVPIYETSSADQVEWIIADSGAVFAFVETAQQAGTVAGLRSGLPALREVCCFDDDGLDQFISRGCDVPRGEVEARRKAVTSDCLATIVYTSGTTGRPKGCAITHANLLYEVNNVCLADGVAEHVMNDTRSTLLFLPLAHILARMIQLAAVHTQVQLGHTGDMRDVPPQLSEFRPTSVLSVPRVFEKIYNTAQHKATVEGKGRLFSLADDTAVAYSRSLDRGGPGLLLSIRHRLFDRLVYGKLRAALGGRVEYSVSGGAPLGSRLGHFFRGIGINVLEGYGLTETCAGATLNLPGAQRIGSVGRPLPGVTIRIADDGEILIKGGQVFRGYWQDEESTAEVFDDDGWFRTGDIGELDEDGYLTITGRKKDLIVTSSGKNVAPAVLEDRLRAHWLVSQCVVVGDARPFIAALITIDETVLADWKVERGKPDDASVQDLREDPELLAVVQGAVDHANAAVSAAEAIKNFTVLANDFTVEGGELTPTLKVKRAAVVRSLAVEVESLYHRGDRPVRS
jgi:long-chain acyl-CoA synthetase